MKILHLFCALLVATSIANAEQQTSPSIVGTWSGKDEKGALGAFVFNADGTADLLMNGTSMKDTVVKDQGTITYRFDPSVTPHTLDIIVSSDSGKLMTMSGILEFLSADKMKLRLPKGGPRPADFSGPETEIIVLDRGSTAKK